MNNGSDKENQRKEAWNIRLQHGFDIWISVPGNKHYESQMFTNKAHSFANISITGQACVLNCEHCGAGILRSMIQVETKQKLCGVVDRLVERGCRGILVSGGSNCRGEVPLDDFTEALGYAHDKGLKVLVHSGLIRKETALRLKDCGVDQVLMDVIGHKQTIRDVYHLDCTPDDFLRSLMICCEVGLECAPHVVVGLHFGRVLGEYEALRMIRKIQPRTLVMVVLKPTIGTGMCGVSPPDYASVEEVFLTARVGNPDVFLSLGCAKPPGDYKWLVEKLAIDCGFNGIAFPGETTIEHACCRGLFPIFTEECCSMAGREKTQ